MSKTRYLCRNGQPLAGLGRWRRALMSRPSGWTVAATASGWARAATRAGCAARCGGLRSKRCGRRLRWPDRRCRTTRRRRSLSGALRSAAGGSRTTCSPPTTPRPRGSRRTRRRPAAGASSFAWKRSSRYMRSRRAASRVPGRARGARPRRRRLRAASCRRRRGSCRARWPRSSNASQAVPRRTRTGSCGSPTRTNGSRASTRFRTRTAAPCGC